jgi:hypothetical protein
VTEVVRKNAYRAVWTAVQVGGVAVVKPAHERSVPFASPSRRLCLVYYVPADYLVDAPRRPGSGAEVGGDRGIHDGAPGGWVNAVGTACSARAKVALGDR